MSFVGDDGKEMQAYYSNKLYLIQQENYRIREELDATAKYVGMGKDLEAMLEQIKDNPICMNAWNNFMMTLRITGNE